MVGGDFLGHQILVKSMVGGDSAPDCCANFDRFKHMKVLVPPLRELEAQVFQQLFQYMWSSVLMEGATADQLPGAVAKQWVMQPSKEEESVQRWIDAFQVMPLHITSEDPLI
jgi:hypothetical protein